MTFDLCCYVFFLSNILQSKSYHWFIFSKSFLLLMPYLLTMSDCTTLILDLGRKAGGYKPVALRLEYIEIIVESSLESFSRIINSNHNTNGHTHSFYTSQTRHGITMHFASVLSCSVCCHCLLTLIKAVNGSVLVINGTEKTVLKCTLIYTWKWGRNLEIHMMKMVGATLEKH